ncbi:MAG TPA: alpha/beta hydrolase [Candidatus Limnocylindrales bacterium]|nr:alpha/beta hydrolase [Candidatus Limnocylindrales bacterium]
MIDTGLPAAVSEALEAPEPGERVTVEAAGVPWSALVWGDPASRPLLLIHGVTASAAVWWRLGPALAATGRRVVALDQAGHGRTGHWRGHHRFRDTAADIAAFARAAGLSSGAGVGATPLQVVGHSWGAMTAAALPAAGLRPATLVLLDPPVLPLAFIAREAADPSLRTYADLDEAIAAVTALQPTWSLGDVRANAEALVEVDAGAARSVVLDNGDWDGGLADLRDPAIAGIDIWLIRGEPATGGYVADTAVPAFEAVIGAGHVITIPGASHSPQRTMAVETLAAFLRVLGEP